jgi:nitroimidazol reductase NimA-like FMN-containing flavoprotein (pyridoxamine 5'-phosphate oxidase superfamily)
MTHSELAAHARAILDANRYLTLGTADPDGRPWTSPVYFAAGGEWEFYWVSETDARHSRNLAGRPEVSIVVFDSTVAPFHGRAVYAIAEARELSGDDLDHALEVYPGPSHRGARPVTRDEVSGASEYRLYRATASSVWVLCPRPPRQPCPLHGLAKDHRTRVAPDHDSPVTAQR